MEVYFDNSATTCCYETVKDIVVKTMMEDFGNPSAMHQKRRCRAVCKEISPDTGTAFEGGGKGNTFYLRGNRVQ